MSTSSDHLPLAGVVVLDFSHMMQGPWGAEILADLGADVIKVEPLTGERGRGSGTVFVHGHSAQYLAMNKNKRSVAVDLKKPDGLALVRRLVERADVLVQNFRPGTMERLGLGWDEVRHLNPRLVYCRATGYGEDVPDPSMPGQDLLAQARTGAMWLTGRADDPPVPIGPFVADIHAATMLAVGALAALHRRAVTGAGGLVEVDLVGAMLHQQVQEVSSFVNGPAQVQRHQRPGSPFIEAPYGAYRCADDRWIAISLVTGEDIANLFGRPELATRYPDKESAVRNRNEIYELFETTIAERPQDEWLQVCARHGIWAAPVNDYATMQHDPYVAWDRRSAKVDMDGVGELTLVNNPLRVDGRHLPVRMPPPRLGEHGDEVFRAVGLDQTDIDDLRSRNVIG